MPRNAVQPKEPTEAQIAAREAGGERLREAARRRTQIASTRKMVESEEQKVGQDHPRAIPSTGPARAEPSSVQPVEGEVSKHKLDELAFMEEVVTVMVHDSTDDKAEPYPGVWNDGISQYFVRGQEQQVKRKFVEVLARMKRTTYGQEKVFDSAGNETYRMIPHTALMNPFVVIGDTPRGIAWLKKILAEA